MGTNRISFSVVATVCVKVGRGGGVVLEGRDTPLGRKFHCKN